MSIRTERVASLLKHEISAIIARDYSGTEYGFITVTDVRVSGDLKIAKVFFSVLGDEKKRQMTMAMLEQEKTEIRGQVAGRVRLKFTPVLQFFHDTTLDEVDKINRLINKIHENDGHDNGSSS